MKYKEKRSKIPKCPRCKTGGYTEGQAWFDKRPEFTCTQCGNIWTQGKLGGEYAGQGKRKCD
jgi:transposase-like protein